MLGYIQGRSWVFVAAGVHISGGLGIEVLHQCPGASPVGEKFKL